MVTCSKNCDDLISLIPREGFFIFGLLEKVIPTSIILDILNPHERFSTSNIVDWTNDQSWVIQGLVGNPLMHGHI